MPVATCENVLYYKVNIKPKEERVMGLTAYAQEEKAKREAWREISELRKHIAELEKERAVRDLRQQAIGVSKAAKYLSTDNYDEYQDFTKWLNEEADELEQE